ncbi:hypothetical protein QYM36_017227 [Artemia franciscana]|uniref:Uncharacterized protein n=1 Tax=Artemia franciscana TaxID=6661 RepID=A0AA88H578_ARTSF|nr:hypothetical protein QYM36_017227 [Artemia franciscana]
MTKMSGGEEYIQVSFSIITCKLCLIALHILKVDETSERFKPLRKFLNALGKIFIRLNSYYFLGHVLEKAWFEVESWFEVKERRKSHSAQSSLSENLPEWYINEINNVHNLILDLEPKKYSVEYSMLKIRQISLVWCLFFCYVKEQLNANDPALIELIRAIEYTKDNLYKPLKEGKFNRESLEEVHGKMKRLGRENSNSFDIDQFLPCNNSPARQRSTKKINEKIYKNENTDSNSDQPKAKKSGHTKKKLNVKKHSKRSPSVQREGSFEANNNSDEEGENEIQHVRARPRLKQQKPPIRHLSFEEDDVEEPIDSDPAGNESSDSRSDRAGKAKRKDHRKKLFSKLDQLGNKMISKYKEKDNEKNKNSKKVKDKNNIGSLESSNQKNKSKNEQKRSNRSKKNQTEKNDDISSKKVSKKEISTNKNRDKKNVSGNKKDAKISPAKKVLERKKESIRGSKKGDRKKPSNVNEKKAQRPGIKNNPKKRSASKEKKPKRAAQERKSKREKPIKKKQQKTGESKKKIMKVGNKMTNFLGKFKKKK